MAGSAEMASISDSSQMQSRIRFYLKKAAIAVMAEEPATANHAERVVYADEVIGGTAPIAEAAHAIVTNSTLTTNGDSDAEDMGISDGDLEFTVNSMYNAFAGVATA